MENKLSLKRFYNSAENSHNEFGKYQIGVDEVGRGPLFGRVYCASVILPKNDYDENGNSYDFSKIKDSKKFTSKKKIIEVANYIKKIALSWDVSYVDEDIIDNINILQATQFAMHNSIKSTIRNLNKSENVNQEKSNKDYNEDYNEDYKKYFILVDGNYFNPITFLNKETNKIDNIPYVTIEGGDNKYISIAAASILAKVERDNYIAELVLDNPDLAEKYSIDTNKGYGTKKHLDGIKKYGITKWHRKSFSPCKHYI